MGSREELFVGVVLCFTSATLSNLGLIVMKAVVTMREHKIVASFTYDEDESDLMEDSVEADGAGGLARRKEYAERRTSSLYDDLRQTTATSIKVLSKANLTWLLGMLTFTVGQVLNLVALSHLEQVVWAVLSLFSLVTNAIFSSLILGEPFSLRDVFATGLILIGSVLVVLANDTALTAGTDANSSPWTIPEFIAHFSRPWFLVYCGLVGTLLCASILHGIRAVGRGHTVHALTWTIFSASSGSVSVLLGKCITELITLVAETPQGISSPQAKDLLRSVSTYVIVVVFVTAALSALVSLNMALAAGEALLVVPWLTVINTLLAILGGVFYFEEFSSFQSLPRILLFAAGVSIAMLGSVALQRGRVNSARRLSIDASVTQTEHSRLIANGSRKTYS